MTTMTVDFDARSIEYDGRTVRIGPDVQPLTFQIVLPDRHPWRTRAWLLIRAAATVWLVLAAWRII